jgi:xylulokinase
MLQAVFEGVAYALRDSLEVARRLGVAPERTTICGGGAKSPLWRKIVANIMNLKVDTVEVEEGPAYGGAILAAVACGTFKSVEEATKQIVRIKDTTVPEEALVAKYEKDYDSFVKLYPALKEAYRTLI